MLSTSTVARVIVGLTGPKRKTMKRGSPGNTFSVVLGHKYQTSACCDGSLGRILEGWPAVCDLAIEAHRAFRNHVIVGWDMAWTDDGPMVIEGNSNLEIAFPQRVHHLPFGEDRLGELLHYHRVRLEKELGSVAIDAEPVRAQ